MLLKLNKRNELIQRLTVAAIAIPLVLGVTRWNEWGYFMLFLGVELLVLREFYQLARQANTTPMARSGALFAILSYTLMFLCAQGLLPNKCLYSLLLSVPILCFLKLHDSTDVHPFASLAYTFFGLIYVAMPFAVMHWLVFMQGVYRYEILWGLLFMIWTNDTGAYFVGKKFGRHKLLQRVSPKKTWEGAAGGIMSTLLLGFGIAKFYPIFPLNSWIVIAGIVSITGIYGDLIESLFKRSIQVKDTGSLLPGHGGFLDRFDSLLAVVPFVLVWIKLIFLVY